MIYAALLFACLLGAIQANLIYDVFELDGNLECEQSVDWVCAYRGFNGNPALYQTYLANTAYADLRVLDAKIIADEQNPDQIFVRGGSKDYNDVSGKGGWAHGTGSVPDKNDIRDVYAASVTFTNGAGTRFNQVYFAADTFATDGNNFLGFWFFINPINDDANGRRGDEFSGSHNDKDFLILVNFANGGDTVSVEVYSWTTLKTGSTDAFTQGTKCTNADGSHPVQSVCAQVNENELITIPTDLPSSTYTPKSGAPGTYPPASFVEGAVDLIASGLGGDCLAAVLAETRSSTSIGAVLKDYALFDFQSCGGGGGAVCEGTPASYVVAADGLTVTYTYPVNVVVENFGVADFDVRVTASYNGQSSSQQDTVPAGSQVVLSFQFSTTDCSFSPSDVTFTGVSLADNSNVDIAASGAVCPTAPIQLSVAPTKTCQVFLEETTGPSGTVVAVKKSYVITVTNDGPAPAYIDVTHNFDNGQTAILDSRVFAKGETANYQGEYFVSSIQSGTIWTNQVIANAYPGNLYCNNANVFSSGDQTTTAMCDLCP